MKTIEKAWSINSSNLNEPWFADTDNIYFGTRGQAKKKALLDHDSMQTDSGDDLTFLNIRVKREKEYDNVIFRGEKMSKDRVNSILEKEKRNSDLDKMLKDYPKGKAFVWNGNYNQYWGWNHSGYCNDWWYAGIYDLSEAIEIVKSSCLSRLESVELIKDVDEHNKKVNEKMAQIKRMLI